jgi:amino acid transporter
MLSFISFWRAAAIVLCDIASSAFYAAGIAEGFVGKSAPWFVLAIMLFSYAVRAVYIESCSMFVRGGVYRVVHEALGGLLAKFSVSALMFDYVLTGPISGATAGLYLAGLINDTAKLTGHGNLRIEPQSFAAVFAITVTIYFWRKNVIGLHESSQKALRIMQLTTVMVVLLIGWCLVTIAVRGFSPVPLPVLANIRYGEGAADALGWLRGTGLPAIPLIAILIGLGHSLLAMSGEESLAQVNREIASPKLKNLQRAGFLIFAYSMIFTSLVSFFGVMLIPDHERVNVYLGNLISGLAMHLVGPVALRLLFQAFVVLVGTVILAGAVNTAIVGSNGVLNRVAEDGVMPDWFREPHRKFGTTSRLIGLIAGLADSLPDPDARQSPAAGRRLCIRRGLEFRHESALGAGAAVQETGPARMEGAAQLSRPRRGNPRGAGPDFPGAVHPGRRQPAHQTNGNHLGVRFHFGDLHGVRSIGMVQPEKRRSSGPGTGKIPFGHGCRVFERLRACAAG